MANDTSYLDVDAALRQWATQKLGDDFVLEKIDVSKASVTQKSVVYQSDQDWFSKKLVHEEFFDNQEHLPATWQYSQKVGFDAQIAWQINRGLKSKDFFPQRYKIEFPVGKDDEMPISVNFDSSVNESNIKKATVPLAFNTSTFVSVKPYCSSHGSVYLKICRLQEVNFFCDIEFSGQVRIIGHKKKKKSTKNEMFASIVDAISGLEGFHILENKNAAEGPAKVALFRMEGLCSGEVAIGADVQLKELQSAV